MIREILIAVAGGGIGGALGYPLDRLLRMMAGRLGPLVTLLVQLGLGGGLGMLGAHYARVGSLGARELFVLGGLMGLSLPWMPGVARHAGFIMRVVWTLGRFALWIAAICLGVLLVGR